MEVVGRFSEGVETLEEVGGGRGGFTTGVATLEEVGGGGESTG